MKKTTLFYHFYIPDNNNGFYWFWWLDEQLGLIEKSNLSKSCTINMCITMPMYWNKLMHDHLIIKNTTYENCFFYEKVLEYIEQRYSFVNIISIRDTGELNIYEGSTLLHLWQYSLNNPDEYVIYIHNKGVANTSVQTHTWRQILNEIIINQWPIRYHEMEDYDVSGMLDGSPQVMSGNFWWAKTDYIKTLPWPIHDEIQGRYYYENWLMLNKPKVKVIIQKDVDFYQNTIIYDKNLFDIQG